MSGGNVVLFICEKYFLRFYRPLADRLAGSGFRPIWITLDGMAGWPYEWLDPQAAIERLVESSDVNTRNDIDALCVLERAVFDRPDVFRKSYPYTLNVVRGLERARRLAEVWYRTTTALVRLFAPRAIFIWNGRYLPYRAISAACDDLRQLFFTSEIGWIPGTIFLDRGTLSPTTRDLLDRDFDPTAPADPARADRFLEDYTTHKATMVAQTMVMPAEVRQHLLGKDGTFLLLYGCQVDWDTNVVIGARRFRSNSAAVSFLLECLAAVPGARIVVKTHPLDREASESLLREVVGSRGTVISDIHPHALIEAADAVAVRNSTLGFEALCYGKPLILLEEAKYKHSRLTLDARSVDEGAASLLAVWNRTCDLPDRTVLQGFVMHLLDRYLLPVHYRYFFEPGTLEILKHFAHSESYQSLQRVLGQTRSPSLVDADDPVFKAIRACDLQRAPQRSFLQRQVGRLSAWLWRG